MTPGDRAMRRAVEKQGSTRTTEPAARRPGVTAGAHGGPVASLQQQRTDAIHASPHVVAQRQRVQSLFGQPVQRADHDAPVQRVGMQKAQQDLRGGGIVQNLLGSFVQKHININATGNIDFARVHRTRPNPPQKNTVVADARELKTQLAAGTWTVDGPRRLGHQGRRRRTAPGHHAARWRHRGRAADGQASGVRRRRAEVRGGGR